jgi:hypothetical protein
MKTASTASEPGDTPKDTSQENANAIILSRIMWLDFQMRCGTIIQSSSHPVIPPSRSLFSVHGLVAQECLESISLASELSLAHRGDNKGTLYVYP